MNNEADRLLDVLKVLAQFLFAKKAQIDTMQIDLATVQIFKYVKQDIDHDDQEEICFAAGISENVSYSNNGVWLLDPVKDTYNIVELASSLGGFRDLLIIDINNDQVPEILFFGQAGSGAFLSLSVFQWNENAYVSLLPEQPNDFYQGYLELKDIDADGIDEIIVWKGVWDNKRANWDPKPFYIHIFHYNGHMYELQAVEVSTRCYAPNSIVSRIYDFGIPTYAEHRFMPVEEYWQRYSTLTQAKQVDEQFITELSNHQEVLWNETFYQESLEIGNILIEAIAHLSDAIKKAKWLVIAWHLKGATFSVLGDYPNAIHSYRQALSFWIDDPSASFPIDRHVGLHRELAFMYAMTGDFEHAMVMLSTAEVQLNTLDLTIPENKGEQGRLHSAFALAYSWLGESSLALASFSSAILIEQEQGNSFSVAINYTGMGNVLRAIGSYQEALQAYQSALNALDLISERDREADVYLEMGLTLVLTAQYEEGLKRLQLSLLLTSMGNLQQQGAKHYLYLGEAYKEMGDMHHAKRFFKKALQFIEKFDISETKWQVLYGLALVYEREELWQEALHTLIETIETIEQLRSQYLPEALKISFFANKKAKVYETMVLLCYSLGQSGSFVSVSVIENAFDYIERAKSRVFIEELSTTSTQHFEGLPGPLADQEVALVNNLRNLQLRYRAAANAQRYEWGNDITQVESRLEQLWSQLSSTGPKGMEYVELRRAIPLKFTGVKSVLKHL
ncbi:MAG: hypothetical protein M3Z24_14495 [Chloroflexota bacterium]|nr:hypothetical protein [Chloroflexota bacterium]